MSASFVVMLILMKILEISAIVFVPWGLMKFIGLFNDDVRHMFYDVTPLERILIWVLGVCITIVTCLTSVGIVLGINALWHANIVWLTALLG